MPTRNLENEVLAYVDYQFDGGSIHIDIKVNGADRALNQDVVAVLQKQASFAAAAVSCSVRDNGTVAPLMLPLTGPGRPNVVRNPKMDGE